MFQKKKILCCLVPFICDFLSNHGLVSNFQDNLCLVLFFLVPQMSPQFSVISFFFPAPEKLSTEYQGTLSANPLRHWIVFVEVRVRHFRKHDKHLPNERLWSGCVSRSLRFFTCKLKTVNQMRSPVSASSGGGSVCIRIRLPSAPPSPTKQSLATWRTPHRRGRMWDRFHSDMQTRLSPTS